MKMLTRQESMFTLTEVCDCAYVNIDVFSLQFLTVSATCTVTILKVDEAADFCSLSL